MDDRPFLLLSARDLAALLTPALCLDALQEACAQAHADPDCAPQALEFHAGAGTFHIKAGLHPGARDLFAAKLNANFPDNPARGLPTIQGLVSLVDARDGRPLALLHSGELTAWRTAAATALAARHGARGDSAVMTLIGCGAQAAHQARAIAGVAALRRIHAFDLDRARAEAFAARMSQELGLDAAAAGDLAAATLDSDICVACTTSTSPVVMAGMVRPGAFVAGVGADNPKKQELDPELFRRGAVIVDDGEACAARGDLAHAIRAGAIIPAGVRASLAELAAGAARGRRSAEEIVVYDSTGTALQDVAVARAAWTAALAAGAGTRLDLEGVKNCG